MEKKKAYFDWRDICERYGCCKSKAYGIISAIRMYCNETVLPVGKVLPEEVEYWESNHFLKRNSREDAKEGAPPDIRATVCVPREVR